MRGMRHRRLTLTALLAVGCVVRGAPTLAAEPGPGPAAVPAAPAPPAPVPYSPPAGSAVPPTAPTAAATFPSTSPSDEVLRRILRSGCRDGLADVRTLVATGAAPWAETVGRLCGEILQAPPAPTLSSTRLASPSNEGRGVLVVWSTLYGIWTGIAADLLFTINGAKSVIIPPMLGMAAGLGLSLVVTGDHPVSSGEAWTINTGLDYGTINGALWAGGLDFSVKSVVGTALATGITGGSLGILVADRFHPEQGNVELVRSGLLWGTVTGMLGMAAAAATGSQQTFFRGMAVSMDLGFLGGLALAASFDLGRNRVLIIDAGTLGGGLAGLGIAWLITAGPNMSGRPLAGGALAGMFAGMIAAAYLTRNLDHHPDDSGPATAALLGRDERGRWSWGTPGPSPLMDRFGQRLVGVTFNALAGTF
jgi:hypothetical protein